MKLTGWSPAKNLVLLAAIKTKKSATGNIILTEEQFVGYYKVIKVGPLCDKDKGVKVGEYVTSTLQMGVEMTFDEGIFMQLPEQGIDGYYQPTVTELATPTPILKDASILPETGEINVIDSERDGGNNSLGTEPNLREN